MQTTRTSGNPPFVNEPYAFTQAGGHPFALTTKVAFATETGESGQYPTGDPKDVLIELPPGLIVDPQAAAACSPQQAGRCPADSQVGVAVVRTLAFALTAPVVNLAPTGEEAAKLGLEADGGVIPLFGRLLPTPGGYALSVAASGLAVLGISSIELTLWGFPADEAHAPQRGLTCTGDQAGAKVSCHGGGLPDGEEARPFLTLPSVCSGQASAATVWADSWEEPSSYLHAQSSLPPVQSCASLSFSPQLELRPDTLAPEAPVAADIAFEQPQLESPSALSAPLRNATVTLPQGMAVNVGIGNGVQFCPASGPEGIDIPSGVGSGGQPLSPSEVGVGEELGAGGEPQLAPGRCPAASTIGLAQARSPLLAGPIAGRVYLAAPACGGGQPCGEQDAADGRLYRIYLELGGVGERHPRGVIVKLAGEVLADPATGQLNVRLSESPQLPLVELRIELFGGSRALLTNPLACGIATTTSALESWGAPFVAVASPTSHYEVTGCAGPQPFAPTLTAGSQLARAGDYSPFVIQLERAPGEQQLSQLQVRAPLGLSATLASVQPCPDAQAGTGSCPAGALVGSSTVALGSGDQPLYLGGEVYLTGAYGKAPFGLAIVTDAHLGPLRLGSITIRAGIEVDPHSGALTITSERLPQIVLGVPLRLRGLTLDIDRPGFVLNPTNCSAQRVTATLLSVRGAAANASTPFGIGGCRMLAFAPRLSATTSAHTSLAGGASLGLKLTEPSAVAGTEANLAKLRVVLPRVLPTRLTALHSSCPQRAFAANPALCPAASVVGIGRARTPLLSASLEGPVYLVAHGRDALPSPTLVLQGQGVTLELSGSSAVERGGLTAIAFAGLPDMPLRSVELYLPRGPHSVFAATGKLCARRAREGGREVAARLPLRTELVAQNGAALHKTVAISVLGCPPAR